MSKITLTADQQRVVTTRGSDLQVIACAGSGKTESIARRVAALIEEGEQPESIIAFTFTEKAAGELKDRIYRRVEEIKGAEFLGRLGPMYVGTIHGYCFRLLQNHVPKYGNYDVLDDHRHAGLLSREHRGLGLNSLGDKHWQPIRDFAQTVDVIGNELIPLASVEGTPLGDCYAAYLEMLERYHFLTFSLIIAKAVDALNDSGTYTRVHGPLRHLIVDEYQDINPAQERLIELLAGDPVELCVVGDDDQSIYQWRGSDLTNILAFRKRRPGAVTIKLETNRRSRPQIVARANTFAKSIPARLDKVMDATRKGSDVEVVTWKAGTEAEEATTLANTISHLHSKGFRYKDIAVLYRSVRTSAPSLVSALEDRDIPYNCGGRTGLFMQPEISLLGEIHVWIADGNWKDEQFGQQRTPDVDNIVGHLHRFFGEIEGIKKYLEDWKAYRLRSNRPISLVGDLYKLLHFLGAHNTDIDDPEGSARFGAYARFSKVLADFEHVTRRGRYVDEDGRRVFRGGRDRGKPFYQRLNNYLLHYAKDAYEDFEGEQTLDLDAVDILTVHQSKGLEWPVVFMPAMTNRRFPSSKSGQSQEWLLPEDVFPLEVQRRYEGGDAEERRLFYVAMTRARDVLYMSCFERITRAQKPSPYLAEVAGGPDKIASGISEESPPVPDAPKTAETPPLEIGFSDIANFEECAYRYRLSRVFGFQIELAIELGYGKALHHVLRQVAETSKSSERLPTDDEIAEIMAKEFYLPFADNPTFERMHRAAGLLIDSYVRDYSDDLLRVWETERPFEIHLTDGILAGRADIILDEEDGTVGRLAIVDYKSATDPLRDERYRLQLAVYAAAGRGEGLDVVAGYLHELKDGTRHDVDVGESVTTKAMASIEKSVKGIRAGVFNACPETNRCEICDYKYVCTHSAAED